MFLLSAAADDHIFLRECTPLMVWSFACLRNAYTGASVSLAAYNFCVQYMLTAGQHYFQHKYTFDFTTPCCQVNMDIIYTVALGL